MSFEVVEHKLRVFISSRCGGEGNKYTVARKALKSLLEATSLMTVYAFETAPASSQDTIDSYSNYIDESNLCLFLVDNKDDVTEAVLREQKRAKDKQLRLLYIFCDEDEKKPTIMQEEIKASFSEKYKIVHEFADIVSEAYKSVMQDIIDIYRQKKIILEKTITNENEYSECSIISGDYKMNKELLLNFPFTIHNVASYIYPQNDAPSNPSEIDSVLSAYFDLMMRERRFDDEYHKKLVDCIINYQNSTLKDVLVFRFKAIELYYKNRLNEALVELQNAINQVIEDTALPNWLALDIAIDIRHIQAIIDESQNCYTMENSGQIFIDQNTESVYYPLLDRECQRFYEEICDEYSEQILISPYTVRFGGINYTMTLLGNAFCIAALHGSLVQTQLIRHRMVDFLKVMCAFETYHDFEYKLIKTLVLDLNSKELKKYMRNFDSKECTINSKDVDEILKCVDNIPIPHRKRMAKMMVIGQLGDFMSDKSFEKYSAIIKAHSLEWIEDSNRIFDENVYIIDFYKNNILRLGPEAIAEFVKSMMDNRLLRFTDDCFTLIKNTSFLECNEEYQKDILNILLDCINGNIDVKNTYLLQNAIILFVLKSIIDHTELDDVLKQRDIEFYNTRYLMEIEHENEEKTREHITRYISMANSRSKTQGNNGVFSQYVYEPLDVVSSLIRNKSIILTDDDMKAILDTVIMTFSAEKQSISAKISAAHLTMQLYSMKKEYTGWEKVAMQLKDKKDTYTLSHSTLFSNETTEMLVFSYTVMMSCLDEDYSEKVIDMLLNVEIRESLCLIYCLQSIKKHLQYFANDEICDDVLIAYMHFCIMMSTHHEVDVRFNAVICLIWLTHFKICQKKALKRLSGIMDSTSSKIKSAIVSRIKYIEDDEKEYTKYILQKGKADNSFIVRSFCNKD